MEQLDLKSVAGLMAVVFIFAGILKHAFPNFPNRAIPLLCLAMGIPGYIVVLAGNEWSVMNFATAFGSIVLAIGTHSMIKNTGQLLMGKEDEAPKVKVPALAFACVLFLMSTGCTTVDPNTGARVYDAVKTEQVKAALKPFVTGLVAHVVTKNPDTKVYFSEAASLICEMRDTRVADVAMFRQRLIANLEAHVAVDPLVKTAYGSIIAVFEINYASRLRADLPPDQFVFNLLDVLCDGVRGGIAGTP